MKAGFISLSSAASVWAIALVSVAALCTGCGEYDGARVSPTASGTGVKLEIDGTLPAEILVGFSFRFAPTVQNPNGVSLSFTASNLPNWMSLDASTGEITGRPDASDVGFYSDIRLTVSGGGAADTSPAYAIEVVAVAPGAAVVSWLPPTERTDGSPLTNLAGYKIYYGPARTNLHRFVVIDNPGASAFVIHDLTPATWYFAATAYDADGSESAYSNIASKNVAEPN